NENGGETNITGGEITDNTAGGNGGGVNNEGDLDVDGGNISGNTAGGNGGGINTGDGGNTNINDGNITGNEAENGGGVNTEDGGTTNIKGGEISENTAENNGGGVNNENGGETNITGGEITDNTAGGNGGGVNNEGDLDVDGGNIGDNTAGGNGDDVNTGNNGNTDINGGNVSGDVNTEPGGNTNVNGGTTGSKDSAINNGQITVILPNGKEDIVTGSAFKYMLDIDGATYKLTENLQLTKDLVVPEDISVTLDLNGFVLKGTGSGSVVTNKGNLTLIDSNPTAVHKYTKGNGGLYTLNDANGNITVKGGAITGGNIGGDGGGVRNYYGTFTMEGGNIVGNTANMCGGGVSNCEDCTFNMTGGNIEGNLAISTFLGGGGVFNDGTFTMKAGTIANNRSSFGGGVLNGNFNGECTFTMESGTITGNEGVNGGGGVFNKNGTFNMEGGTITNNKRHYAAYDTGVENQATFNMKGGGIDSEIVGSATIFAGYFGAAAKNSINTDWLADGLVWSDNSGSDARYPKDVFTHKLENSPYV
ncbi:MAG: hypothetical protein J6Q42_04315, partial [Clostridia bacterium]|nr:hypothetical protein [Clostridia bacterium]